MPHGALSATPDAGGASPTGKGDLPRLPIRTHLAISSFWLANNLHWGALGILIVPNQATRMQTLVGLKEAEITGWTIGMGAIVGALVPPIVGMLSDRCRSPLGRRRPYVIGGTVLNIAALFIFYLAFRSGSLAAYIAAWMLIGLGNNIAVGAYSGIIPDVVPAPERGVASGWMAGMQQVGMIGGFLIGGMLMTKGREQDLAALAVIAGVLGIITAITVLGTPERRLTQVSPFRWQELKSCFWLDPRKHPDFGWVWITRAFFTTGWWLIQPTLQYFMRDVVRSEDPAAAVSLLGGVVLIAAVFTGVAGGVLSDRWGRKRIICIAGLEMAVTCAGFAALGWLPVELRVGGVYALAVLWGCGYGAYLSVDWALGTDVLPNPDDAGKDMGVWHLSMVVPQALAAPAAGLLLRPFAGAAGQGYTLGGYTLLFGVSAIFMVLCGALIFQVKKAR